ncbi:MAG: 3-oxoacyl-ACP reductase FabG [Methylobacter sp.]|uniref:3-oxoacyl-ACP reductase FabG n=1 Tax=Candidatus Methylobacter titanis TaxID=3053457 RepID=A0AA43Q651_9GAMM|nr:3-oxoacyl-ACP reductase FabG [Candidatus Methylobacter titanis]
MRFANKIIIITGASEGIGKFAAEKLVKEGAQLVINARGIERLDQLKEELSEFGHTPLVVAGDATLPATAECLANKTLKQFGRIDGLVNNIGGASHLRYLEDITDEDWDHTHNFNLKSAFLLCKQVIPIMKAQRYGRVVNVSSLAGRNKSRLGGLQYASAKAGLLGLTRHLASEVGSFGITVNAVAPGIALTERAKGKWEALSAQEREHILTTIPLHRLAQPEEMAGAIVFLISDEASYITGVSLDVNGGSYMA